VRSDCNHLFRMTQLGIDFSLIVGKTDMVPRLVKYFTMARWGKRVKKLGVSSKGTNYIQIVPTLSLIVIFDL
jgi:hypothetical protein